MEKEFYVIKGRVHTGKFRNQDLYMTEKDDRYVLTDISPENAMLFEKSEEGISKLRKVLSNYLFFKKAMTINDFEVKSIKIEVEIEDAPDSILKPEVVKILGSSLGITENMPKEEIESRLNWYVEVYYGIPPKYEYELDGNTINLKIAW